MKKRILSLFLAVLMVVSMLPVTALAAEGSPEQELPVEVLPMEKVPGEEAPTEDTQPPEKAPNEEAQNGQTPEEASNEEAQNEKTPEEAPVEEEKIIEEELQDLTPEPAEDAAVSALLERIEALPAAEALSEMTKEDLEALIAERESIFNTYDELTPEQREQIDLQPLYALYAAEEYLETAPSKNAITGQYIDRSWSGSQVVSTPTDIPATAQPITAETTTLDGGWYYVDGTGSPDNTITNGNRLVVNGTSSNPTRIVLLDGSKLSLRYGINVQSGKTLYIYGQTNDTGTIDASSWGYNSVIGGGENQSGGLLTVFGGTLIANAGQSTYASSIGGGFAGNGGTLIQYGGSVTASSVGTGSGTIGNGNNNAGWAGSVTIYDGKLEAVNYGYGAGIGGGMDDAGGNFTMYGGEVKAQGGQNGAGIGGGRNGAGGTVNIYGGTLEAIGGRNYNGEGYVGGAGIGGGVGDGANRGGGTLTITGGTVRVAGGAGAPAITGTMTATDLAFINPESYAVYHKPASGNWAEAFGTDAYFTVSPIPEISYRAYNTASGAYETKTTKDYEFIGTNPTVLNGGLYALLDRDTTVPGTLTVNGEVGLILKDSRTLTVNNGIIVGSGNTLSIYAQSAGEGMGTLSVDGTNDPTNNAAGICNVGSVFVHGGNITATGDTNCAGIGGGDLIEDAGVFTMYGGNVEATGGTRGAGIGGGDSGDGGTIIINGGSLKAAGGLFGAGIGGGEHGDGASFVMNGGKVIAFGNKNSLGEAPAIGGGDYGLYSGDFTVNCDVKVICGASEAEAVQRELNDYIEVRGNTRYVLLEAHAHDFTTGRYKITADKHALQCAGCAVCLEAEDHTVENGVCTVCNAHIHSAEGGDAKVFAPITTVSELKALFAGGGSGYLANDITADAALTVSKKVELCLNDHLLNLNQKSISIGNGGELILDDCGSTEHTVGDQTVTGGAIYGGTNGITYSNKTYYANVIVTDDSGFTLNGGNIVGSPDINASGVVVLGETAGFTMNGGAICGHRASSAAGVHVNSGSFTMNGGSICHNRATMSTEFAGGLYVNSGSFIMNGGSIDHNTTHGRGGGIYVSDGSVVMNGGTIANNSAHHGGGVYLYSGSFTMKGGSVKSNTASENEEEHGAGYGGGVYVGNGTSAQAVILGGEITGNSADQTDGGGVYAYRSLKLGGTAVIKDNTAASVPNNVDKNVSYGSVTISEDTAPAEGMEVGINSSVKVGNAKAGDQKYFFSDDPDKDVAFMANSNEVAVVGHAHDDAEGNSVDIFDKPIHNLAELKELFANGGSGYLLANITADGKLSLAKEKEVKLCLNGKVLDLNGKELGMNKNCLAIPNKAHFILCDCDTETVHTFGDDNGRWVWDDSLTGDQIKHTVTGGVITGGNNVGDGCVEVYPGTFTMEGGTLAGNYGHTVNIYLATFNMKGGTICGNRADTDGVVYIASDSTFNMTGGEITGNMAGTTGHGGGVNCEGTGKLVVGGSAKIIGNFRDTGDSKTADNVYLRINQSTRSLIYVGTGADAPVKGMEIGVATQNAPSMGGSTEKFAANAKSADVSYFIPDRVQDRVLFKNGELHLEANAYAITNAAPQANAETNHGYITVAEKAVAGNTVSVTVKPAENYELKSLIYNDGTDHDITEAKSFTMPAKDVTVKATFKFREHSHEFTDAEYQIVDNEYHKGKCTVCGEWIEEEHNFDENGVCVCGLAKDVAYIDRSWDEANNAVTESDETADYAIILTADMTELNGGWYYLKNNVTTSKRIKANGTTENPTCIILGDGCDLDAKKGITVDEGKELRIYVQSAGTGHLSASGDTYNAGIGGFGKSGGTVSIYGGYVTANGAQGAGIGGGYDNENWGCNGGTVNIFGGTITAKSADGAGIGGGESTKNGGNGGIVNIYGGNVTATGGGGSAGIGGGDGKESDGNGGTVNIYGGTVTATGKNGSVGIGGAVGSEDHGSLTVSDTLDIYAGDAAPGSRTTLERYKTDRNTYVRIEKKHIHDLTVTKISGTEVVDALEEEDYAWDATDINKLIILTDGLTVSGTTTKEYIEVAENVGDLTIDGLTITGEINYPISFNGDDGELILKGTNVIDSYDSEDSEDKDDSAIFFNKNGVISGSGDLTATGQCNGIYALESLTISTTGTLTATGGAYDGICSEGTLTVSAPGSIVAKGGSFGFYAIGGIKFEDTVGKVLAYGKHDYWGAIVWDEGGRMTVETGLTVKGSTTFEAAEDAITDAATFKATNMCVKVKGEVAKSVLISKSNIVRDLSIKKGINAAEEGVDYKWDTDDDPNMLIILKDGLTVSGSTTKEYIEVAEDVSELTIDGLTITNIAKAAITFSGNGKLSFEGMNVLNSEGAVDGIVFDDNGEISGNGDLTVTSDFDGIFAAGTLTISTTGTLTVTGGDDGIETLGTLTVSAPGSITVKCDDGYGIFTHEAVYFTDTVGKVLAYGTDDECGAITWNADFGMTVANELTVKGSTTFEAEEDAITDDASFEEEDECVKVGDNVAKSVLITKKPATPYDIYVNGKMVTSVNASDVFGDGKVSYNVTDDVLNVKARNGNLTIVGNGTADIVIDGGTDIAVQGTLTVSKAHDVTVSSQTGSPVITGATSIDCTGNVLIQNTGTGYSMVSDLTVTNANNVTVRNTSETNTLPVITGQVKIACDGDILLEHKGDSYVAGWLTVTKAKSVTVSANSSIPTITSYTNISDCSGNVSITNSGTGHACGSSVYVDGAADVTIKNTNISSTNEVVYGSANITCSGDVLIQNTGTGSCVSGKLTVTNANNVTVKNTNTSATAPVLNSWADITCTGDITITSAGTGYAINGSLDVKGAKNVTVSAASSTPAIYDAEITCSGDVVIKNTGTGNAVSGDLTVKDAKSVTVSANSSNPTITGTTNISDCSGNVSLTNSGTGNTCGSAVIVDGAADVTIKNTNTSSTKEVVYGSANITCSGDVLIQNTGTGIAVYGKLTVSKAKSVTVSANSGNPTIIGYTNISDCTGNVSLTNSGTGSVCVSPVTVNGAADVTIKNTNTSTFAAVVTGTVDITCTGDITLTNAGTGSVEYGSLNVRSAKNVTVSTKSSSPTISSTANIACSGNVLLENKGDYYVASGAITVSSAKNVTIRSNSASDFSPANINPEITCTGDLSITNSGTGAVCGGTLTVHSAANVTVQNTNSSSNTPVINGNAVIASSGDVLIQSSGSQAACRDSITYSRITGAGDYVVKTGDTESGLTAVAKMAESETYGPESCTNKIFKIVSRESELIRYDVWVNGEQVNSENKDNILEDTGAATAAYDPDTKTLTLTNAAITKAAEGAGIHAKGDLNIVLAGTSNSIALANTPTYHGIDVSGKLTISGEGGLSIVAPNGGAYGIKTTGSIEVTNSGDLTVTAGDRAIYSDGGAISLGNTGNLTVEGGSYGIYAYAFSGKITITSTGAVKVKGRGSNGIESSWSTVSITGASSLEVSSSSSKQYGIIGNSNVTITGIKGDIRVTTTGDSGIVSNSGSVTIENTGSLTVSAANKNGIYADDNTKISSTGDVSVTAGTDGHGIMAEKGWVTVSSANSLTIKAEASNKDGILAGDEITIADTVKNVSIEAGHDGISTPRDVAINNSGKLTITAGNYGIYNSSTANPTTIGSTGGAEITAVNAGIATSSYAHVTFSGRGEVKVTSTNDHAIKITGAGGEVKLSGTASPITLTGGTDKKAVYNSKDNKSPVTDTDSAYYIVSGAPDKQSVIYKSGAAYPVWVNGVQFTAENASTGITCGDGKATLNVSSAPITLTLTDAEITDAEYDDDINIAGIFAQCDLKIVSAGTKGNTVAPTGEVLGIFVIGKLSVEGSADLTVESAYYGIIAATDEYTNHGEDLTFSNTGAVTVKCSLGSGIWGGKTELSGSGDVTIEKSWIGISAEELTVSGEGDLKIKSTGDGIYANVASLSGSGDVDIEGDELGIYIVHDSLTLSGSGKVTVKSTGDAAVFFNDAEGKLLLDGTGSPITLTAGENEKAVYNAVTEKSPVAGDKFDTYFAAYGAPDEQSVTYFSIPMSIDGATVGEFAEMTYNGKAQTPVATVTVNGLTVTGSWSNVTNVGDKTTFTANGNFTGTITDRDPGMKKAVPTADLFTFTAPENLTEDGQPKAATVTVDESAGVSGVGGIKVKYQAKTGENSWGAATENAPTDAGTYKVTVDVEEGDNYLATTGVGADDWKFTIAAESYDAEANNCFYIENLTDEAGKVTLNDYGVQKAPVMKYSTDGKKWKNLPLSTEIDIAAGGKVWIRGINNAGLSDDKGQCIFSATVDHAVGGDISTLLDGKSNVTELTAPYAFSGLFYFDTTLKDASKLILPAATVTEACYSAMFFNDNLLENAPALPATTLAEDCYLSMFAGCTALMEAPVLSATTLADGCYNMMFLGCTSLKSTPVLPATTLAEGCYYLMFSGCTSLKSAPVLPATTLADGCYFGMFYGCTSLDQVSVGFMAFNNDNYSTYNWLEGVAEEGTFYAPEGFADFTPGSSTVPEKWLFTSVEDQYNVTIADTENGTVEADRTQAGKDETVTLTVTPAEGYMLKTGSLKVTYSDGTEDQTIIPSAGETAGQYTFTMPAYDVTVTAEFAPAYTVTFDKNGGDTEAAPNTISQINGEKYILPTTAPTRTGYTFAGWYTAAEGGTKVTANTTVSLTTAQTLYAHWDANTYYISFDANGGEGSTEGNRSYKYGTEYTLPVANNSTTEHCIKRYGYTFAGWALSADGEVVYGDQATVSNLTAENKKTVTLYAVWTPTESRYEVVVYKQKLDKSGYDFVMRSGEMGTTEAEITINPPSTLTGFKKPDPKKVTITAKPTVVVEFYYDRLSYELTWNLAGGSASGTYTSGSVLYEQPITAPVPTKDGYTFAGWNKTVPATMPAGNQSFTALWTANTYTVTLNAGEGASCAALTSYTYGVGATLPIPTKTGYDFAGWFDNDAFEGTAVTEITATDMGAKTFYAKWTPGASHYTVNYYQQKLDGQYQLISGMDVGGTTESKVTVTPLHTYTGFKTPDAQEITITGDPITVVDFYYERLKYTLTWDLAGGTASGDYTPGGETLFEQPLTAPVPTKDGYTFAGWDKTVPAAMPAEAQTFVAQWIENLTGNLSITGEAKYDKTLTATLTGSNNTGTLSYQWKRDNTAITGATGSSYKLTADDIGKSITVTVTSSVETGSLTSGGVTVAKADGPDTPSGLTGVACTTKANNDGKITGTSAAMEYSTSADFTDAKTCTGTEITGLTPGTYYVRVAETATTKAGAAAEVAVNEFTPNALTGTVNIGGEAKYGKTLTATLTGSNNTGTLSYQWKRDNTAITGATGSTYTLTADDISKNITVTVTSSVESGSLTSEATGKVAKADFEITVTNYSAVYDGLAHGISLNGVPEGATVKYGTTEGTYDQDSGITYTDCTNGAKTVYVQVTKDGYNDYTGSGTVTIDPKDIIGATADSFAEMTYIGEAQTPSAEVTVDGMTVTGAWSDVTNVADKTTFTASGNFTGTIEDQATGMQKASAVITVDQTPIEKTYGEAVEIPEASSNFGTVTADKTAEDLVNAGSYTITYTVEGTDNYDGDTKTVEVTINPKNITGATADSFAEMTYTGEAQTPSAEVTVDGMTVTGSWSDVTNVADKTTFTASGNFTGTIEDQPTGMKKASVEITVDQTPIKKNYGEVVEIPEASSNFGTVTADKTAEDLVNARSYTITYTVEGTDNYDGDTKAVEATIDPLAITVTPTAGQTKMQGSAYTIKYTTEPELVEGDSFTGALAAEDEIGVNEITQGTLAISDGNGGKNYDMTFTTGVTLEVQAEPVSVEIPDAVTGLIYDGTEQTGVAEGTGYTLTGNKAADAGSYTATATLSEGYTWSDGTTENKQIAWSIGKADPAADMFSFAAPENLTYDGKEKAASVNAPAGTTGLGGITIKYQKQTGEGIWSGATDEVPKDAGTYKVTADVAEGDNYSSASGLSGENWTFTINPLSVTGAKVGTFKPMTYTGETQTPSASVTVDSMTVTGSWSDVTNVADKTTFTASGNFTGTIVDQPTGMKKADAPAAPEGLVGVACTTGDNNDGKITGTDATMEYSTSADFTDATDCAAPETTGLSAGTYYVRVKETANTNAGTAAEVTVGEFVPEELTGTVDVTGEAKYGKTLTATLAGSNNTGTLSYQWKRDNTAITGATGSSYKLTADDIGKSITVTVTSSVESGSLTSEATGKVAKADFEITVTNYSAVYDGLAHGISLNGVPEGATVKYGTVEGTYDQDSGITYTDCTNGAKTVYVQVTKDGYNDYTGSGTVTIDPKDITGATVGSFAEMTYNGEAQTPSAEVTVDGMTVTGAWSDVTNVADKTTFTANGNFTGTIADKDPGMKKADAPAAPEGLVGVACTTGDNNDGKITGTDATMEYSTSADFTDAKTCTGTETTGLSAGTYYVRVKETANTNAGTAAEVTVDEFVPEELTGTVDVTGEAKYGEMLEAELTGSNNTGDLSYQWKRDNTAITGATGSTYKLTADDIGKSITVTVTSSVETGSLTSEATGKVAKADSPNAPSGLVGVACTTKANNDGKITGTKATMEYSTSADFTDAKTCTGTEITGLTPGTYYVRVAETATTKAGAAAEVAVNEFTPNALTGTVNIGGEAKYGKTLTATLTGSNNTGDLSYQWKRDNTAITDATGSSYKLTADDIGKSITVTVTSSVETGSLTSGGVTVAKADGPDAPSGLTGVACTTKANNDGKITGTKATMEYSTSADFTDAKTCTGTEITGLTPGTYYVRVAETATTKAGAAAEVAVNEFTPNALTGTVNIGGEAKYGKTLTATLTGSNNTGTLSYQWKRDNTAITGATGSSYKPTADDIGKSITVTVTSSVETGSLTSGGVTVAKADGPKAPTGLVGVACTTGDNNDGKITGTDATMEYSTSADFTDAVACTGTEITGLTPGTYYVRVAETATHKAGEPTTLTIKAYEPETVDYKIIAGAKAVWTKGSKDGQLFTSNAPFAKFERVKVDGAIVDAKNYTAKEGSTDVTFTASYMEALSVGNHILEIVSTDGSASTTFTVKSAVPPVPMTYTVTFNMNGHGTQITAQTVESGSTATKPADPTASGYTFDGWYADATFSAKFDFNTAITANTTVYAKWTKNSAAPTDPTSPQTGDNSNMLFWVLLFAASGAALTGTGIYSRKRKKNN